MPTLSAYFLSLKRLSELLPPALFTPALGAKVLSSVVPDNMVRLKLLGNLERGVEEWLVSKHTVPLGRLLVAGNLEADSFFTHLGTFDGSGVMEAAMRFDQGKPLKREARIRTKIQALDKNYTLEIQIHPENYTTMSAAGQMSGRHRLFVLGRLTDVDGTSLGAQAYAIGLFHNEARKDDLIADVFGRLPWHMELFPQQIDTFASSTNVATPTPKQLGKLEHIPETKIKHAFAEIIGEPFVGKDWGGEKSDLTTTQLSIDGSTCAAAFIFKGPAKFKPLTVADLGKNGDQISRAFSEPVDLIVLQHCHKVESAVRDHMRAFACQFDRLRPFTIIDGSDTVKILRAHGKLGYSKPK